MPSLITAPRPLRESSGGAPVAAALGEERAQVVLRLSAAPAGVVRAAHRRVAQALLAAEATRLGGEARLAAIGGDAAGGDPALLGVPRAEAQRVATTLERLFGHAIAPGLAEILPETATCAVSLLRSGAAAGEPVPPELDGRIAALPLGRVARREALLRLQPGEPPALAGIRLFVGTEALATSLGPAIAEDADLLGHAAEALAPRLASVLADPAARRALLGGVEAAVPLFVALPSPGAAKDAAAILGGASDDTGPPFGTVLVLPLSAVAARPEGLAGLRTPRGGALSVALDGLDAEALSLIAPDAEVLAAADWLALRWSPRLAEERAVAAALRRLDPARLLLLGCDGAEALEWGSAQGITRFGGPWIRQALAAARRLACAHASGCTVADCAARAAATDAAGRAGCANLPLLATPLPSDRGLPG